MKPTESRPRLTGDRPQPSPFLELPFSGEQRSVGSSVVVCSLGACTRRHLGCFGPLRVGSSKHLLLFILWFHWRSSSWAPGHGADSAVTVTCCSDIQWLLGTCTASLHGEHSQALSPSHTRAPWRYMFSECWALLGPCTPSPDWFRN